MLNKLKKSKFYFKSLFLIFNINKNKYVTLIV